MGYKKWNCHSVETLAKDLLFAIPKQLSSHVRVSKKVSPLFKKRNVKWHKYCLKDLPGRRFIYMPVLCPAGLPLRQASNLDLFLATQPNEFAEPLSFLLEF